MVEDNLSNGSGWIFHGIGVFFGEYELSAELVSNRGGDEPTIEPVFGSIDGDTIEVETNPKFLHNLISQNHAA